MPPASRIRCAAKRLKREAGGLPYAARRRHLPARLERLHELAPAVRPAPSARTTTPGEQAMDELLALLVGKASSRSTSFGPQLESATPRSVLRATEAGTRWSIIKQKWICRSTSAPDEQLQPIVDDFAAAALFLRATCVWGGRRPFHLRPHGGERACHQKAWPTAG